MRLKTIIRRSLAIILLIGLGYGIYYAWFSFPILSGYAAKTSCSCIFVQGLPEEKARKEDIGYFPLTLASIKVNKTEKYVTSTVFGFAKKTAIYREGWGCTLLNGADEYKLRSEMAPVSGVVFNDTALWPVGDRIMSHSFPGIDSGQLQKAIADAFNDSDGVSLNKTRAVVVLYNGELIAERYAAGITKDTRLLGWSMAKSFTGALIGILVKQGKIDIKQPAPVPEWRSVKDGRQNITSEQVLQQTSGIAFDEIYSSYSEVTNMLFNKADMAGYAASLELRSQPGSVFNYNGGNSNILSRMLRHLSPSDYHQFPYTQLFHKINMKTALMEPDAAGNYVGSSYVYASARDYARFGLLYLQYGKWNGEQILPEDWVGKSVIAPAANSLKNYGYQFWLNGFDKDDPGKRAFPSAPHDMFYASGFNGQNIFIIPSRKLVIVRLGLKDLPDEDGFISSIVKAVK